MNDPSPPLDVPHATPQAPAPAEFARRARRIFKTITVSYLGFIVILYLLQAWLIFPGSSTQGRSESRPREGPGATALALKTPAGDRVAALHALALDDRGKVDPRAKERPSLIFFYGNAMCLADAEPLIDRFRGLGFNVVCPDYLGFGASSGKASEKGCRAAALASYDYLVKDQGVEPGRIIVVGWSLGGGVAVDLASLRPIGGLAVFSTFTSMVEMAKDRMPIVPVSLLLRHRFESLKKIRAITAPTLIGHGRADPIVPFSMGERLARAAGGPVETLWVDRAGHNDFFDVAGPPLDRALKRLADRAAAAREPGN